MYFYILKGAFLFLLTSNIFASFFSEPPSYGTPLVSGRQEGYNRLYALKVWDKKPDGSLKSIAKKFDFTDLEKSQIRAVKALIKKRTVRSFLDGFELAAKKEAEGLQRTLYDQDPSYLIGFVSSFTYPQEQLIKISQEILAGVHEDSLGRSKKDAIEKIFLANLLPPMDQLSQNIEGVKEVLQHSIATVLDGTESLEAMQEKAEKLNHGSEEFYQNARRLRREVDPCCCCCYDFDYQKTCERCKNCCVLQ